MLHESEKLESEIKVVTAYCQLKRHVSHPMLEHGNHVTAGTHRSTFQSTSWSTWDKDCTVQRMRQESYTSDGSPISTEWDSLQVEWEHRERIENSASDRPDCGIASGEI